MSIGLTTVILFAVFGILLFLSCPISVSIVIASIVAAMSSLSWDQITFITMQKMNSGVESFSLLAIPLFILAGNIMNNGGIARRLVNFAKIFVGWIPGSLAQANIVGNMLFGALSGSSVAAASAMGGCIYPIQKDEGYDPAFATAVNIASAPTGLLIPPTSAFIVYSTVAGGVSISTLFMAGYIPGILMGVGSMVVAFIYAKKHKYPTSGKTPMKEALKVTLEAIPSLLLIIIVIGGIVAGIFTATEGAGICVLYCLILSVCYRSITVKSFMKILVSSACTSGIILFLISASSAMSFVMAYSGIPAAISNGIMSISTNKYVIFFLMNVILMVVGMFMDITPAILIFTPIFLPIAQSLGMSDIQFGVMLIFNMCLGNITPPVGSVLFVGCGISKISIEDVTKTLLPYFAVLFLLLLAVTYIPALSLGVFDTSLLSPIEPDVDFQIGDLTVKPFKIDHDAVDPVAYRVESGSKAVAVATDMGHFDQYTIDHLQKLDALLLESNHDVRMLETGPYPYYLKRRILGDHGHLSNENAGRLLNNILHDNLKKIFLGHLSKENNYAELAYETVRLEIDEGDCPYGASDFSISVASRDKMSEVIYL